MRSFGTKGASFFRGGLAAACEGAVVVELAAGAGGGGGGAGGITVRRDNLRERSFFKAPLPAPFTGAGAYFASTFLLSLLF